MEIYNRLAVPLTDPISDVESGDIVTPASVIEPEIRGVFKAQKRINAFFGSEGTVSWNVGGKQIILMWRAPNFFTRRRCNELAVGINPAGGHSDTTFETMVYDGTTNLDYNEVKFCASSGNSRAAHYCDMSICISASMGTEHKSSVTVRVENKA